MKIRRHLCLLFLLLIPLFAAYRWAAKRLPLDDFFVFRGALWLDDRYALITQENHLWSWSPKCWAYAYLLDCEMESLLDLQDFLGIDRFSTRDPFVSVDGCFCLLDLQSRLIKLDPKSLVAHFHSLEDGSPTHNRAVGQRYWVDQHTCLDVVTGNRIPLPEESSAPVSITPVDGTNSFVISYTYTNRPIPSESAFMQEIKEEAKRIGRVPEDLELRVLHAINDDGVKQLAKWFVLPDKFISPGKDIYTSRGLIVDRVPSGDRVAIRDGSSGEVLKEHLMPFLPRVEYNFCSGMILFQGGLGQHSLVLNARSGYEITVPTKSIPYWFSCTNDYLLLHGHWGFDGWRSQVYDVASGRCLWDLSKLDYNSIDFSMDGRSLKLLTDPFVVKLVDLNTGHITNIRPIWLDTWLSQIAFASLGLWLVYWTVICHREVVSSLKQGLVTALVLLLAAWWRLKLAETEDFFHRPAFCVLTAALFWLGWRVVIGLAFSNLHWYVKLLTAQIVFYLWYWFVFQHVHCSSIEAYGLLAMVLESLFCLLVVVHQVRKEKIRTFGFRTLVCATALCAVAIHHFRLITTHPYFDFQQAFEHKMAIPLFSLNTLCLILAMGIASRFYRFPWTALIFIGIGLLVCCFAEDTMNWFLSEIEFQYPHEQEEIPWLVSRWLTFLIAVMFISCNFSVLRAKAASASPAQGHQREETETEERELGATAF